MTRTIIGWMQATGALASLAAFLLLLVGAASASAQTQIGFGLSDQTVSFQATSPGTSMNVGLGSCTTTTFTGVCTLSGTGNTGFDPGDSAMYSFTTTTGMGGSITALNSPPGTTVFPINMNGANTAFAYSSTDGDSLTGSVTWTDVANGSANPHFDGILTIATKAGDAAFLSAFSTSTATFDLILSSLGCNPTPPPVVPGSFPLNNNGGCNLENLFSTNGMNNNYGVVASAPVSSGQMAQTPEPASMLLFGSGLLACGTFIRRRRSVPAVASA
jgi:hypothetical protein